MCGIFFSIARNHDTLPDQSKKDELTARGPDSYKELRVTAPSPTLGDWHLAFASSVLALRGDHVQVQPLHDPSSGSVLCWNGEAWKIDGTQIEGNDSMQIFHLLLQASRSPESEHHQRDIVQVLSKIAGPFAFVFYDAPNSMIYYGRDRLGRRSLLVEHGKEDSLTLCSTSVALPDRRSTEVSTDAVHYVSVRNGLITLGDIAWLETLPAINKACTADVVDPMPLSGSVDGFLRLMTSALVLRVVDIPTHSHQQLKHDSAKVAVLFSGGLDCTLLARLVHEVLPSAEPIDLLNVAFENPRSLAAMANNTASPYELCPDRVTGRASFAELCQVCPGRKWRFVAINVPFSESQSHKSAIQRLMQPHNTEMDLSIAMALSFAARGIGTLQEGAQPQCSKAELYTSDARVLLSGFGADELFAGYARHAAAFARGGYQELTDELDLDFKRIGSRNLGRDDRVMSHWGREVRYPYLDEDLVNYSLGLPVWEKCGFRPGRNAPKHHEEVAQADKPEDLEPAKALLRLAMWKLGMRRAALERKRAIQFGAKTAKMDVGKGRTKGTDVLAAAS